MERNKAPVIRTEFSNFFISERQTALHWCIRTETSIFVTYLYIFRPEQINHCDIMLQSFITTWPYDMLLILGKIENKNGLVLEEEGCCVPCGCFKMFRKRLIRL